MVNQQADQSADGQSPESPALQHSCPDVPDALDRIPGSPMARSNSESNLDGVGTGLGTPMPLLRAKTDLLAHVLEGGLDPHPRPASTTPTLHPGRSGSPAPAEAHPGRASPDLPSAWGSGNMDVPTPVAAAARQAGPAPSPPLPLTKPAPLQGFSPRLSQKLGPGGDWEGRNLPAGTASESTNLNEPATKPSTPAGDGFWGFVAEELRPGATASGLPDDVWGQSERDRVYNAILSVPYQLERFQATGVGVCADAFLTVLTVMPLRLGLALSAAATKAVRAARARKGRPVPSTGVKDGAEERHTAAPATGALLYDGLVLGLFCCMLCFMTALNVGSIYYWLKDLTHEFLKLSVFYAALELGDKICCSFGVDVLEALAGSCAVLAAATRGPSAGVPGPSSAEAAAGTGAGTTASRRGVTRRAAARVTADCVVALCLLLTHCAVLLGQAMVFSVALNSRKNALVGLLIAANFGEIKGTVFKRFDGTKLYNLACQDVVERFHLLLLLGFVVVEEMGNAGHAVPSPGLLARCARIFLAEAAIDVVKHAVVGKFNEIRPGVYREFMRDLSEGMTAGTGAMHRLVGFEPLASAALFVRIGVTYISVLSGMGAFSHGRDGGLLQRLAGSLLPGLLVLSAWIALVLAKFGLGWLLRRSAQVYLRHYAAVVQQQRARGTLRRHVSVAPPATAHQPTPALQQQLQQQHK